MCLSLCLVAETQALRGKKWYTWKVVNIHKLKLELRPHFFTKASIYPRNWLPAQSQDTPILTLEHLRDQNLIYSKLVFMTVN